MVNKDKMIKRRSVRIKVLQALYGFEHSEDHGLNNFAKQLEKRILSVEDLFLYNLLIIRKISDAVENESELIASKHIRTDEDKSFNIKLSSNILIKYLANDEDFNRLIEQNKLEDYIDNVLIKKWYNDFKETEAYQNYLRSSNNFNAQEDRDIIINPIQIIFVRG